MLFLSIVVFVSVVDVCVLFLSFVVVVLRICRGYCIGWVWCSFSLSQLLYWAACHASGQSHGPRRMGAAPTGDRCVCCGGCRGRCCVMWTQCHCASVIRAVLALSFLWTRFLLFVLCTCVCMYVSALTSVAVLCVGGFIEQFGFDEKAIGVYCMYV